MDQNRSGTVMGDAFERAFRSSKKGIADIVESPAGGSPPEVDEAAEVARQITDEVEKIHLTEAKKSSHEPFSKTKKPEAEYRVAFQAVQDAINSGDIELVVDDRITTKVPKTEKGKKILDAYKGTLGPLIPVDRPPSKEENFTNANNKEIAGESMGEKVVYTPEEIDQMDRSRLETYGQMRAGGATEDTLRNASGDVLENRFSPTAEQFEEIRKEGEEYLAAKGNPGANSAEQAGGSEPIAEANRGVTGGNVEAGGEQGQVEPLQGSEQEVREMVASLQEQIMILNKNNERMLGLLEAIVAARSVRPETTTPITSEASTPSAEVAPNLVDNTVEGAETDMQGEGEGEEVTDTEPQASEVVAPESEDIHKKYLTLLASKRRWVLGRPKEENLAEARANYERNVINQILEEAERNVLEANPDIVGEEKEAMIRREAAAGVIRQYVERTAAEAEIAGDSRYKKIFNWIKSHPRLRFVVGALLAGGAVASAVTGNFFGAAVFLGARAGLAGIGVGIATEGIIDYAQKRTNKRLKELTPEQIAQMSPTELQNIISEIGAYEVRRGKGFENSKLRETALGILEQQKQLLIDRMTELEESSGNSEVARGRVLTEFVNSMNVGRETADDSERSRSMVRGIAAVTAGTATTISSYFFGTGGAQAEAVLPTEPPVVPTPEAIVLPEPPLTGEYISIAESGDHIWGITEGNLQKLADRLGYDLTPSQMEAAIDRGKDWYISQGYGRGPNNWLWPGDKVTFDLNRGAEWLRYGMENPKL